MKVKKYKKTITIISILIVAVIMFASFFGVQITNKEGNKVNLIPNYKLGMEFGTTRVITGKVSQEVSTTIYDSEGKVVEPEEGVEYTEQAGYTTEVYKANEDSVKTKENYRETKAIIEQRLKNSKVSEYEIELNEENGEIKIRLPENEKVEEVQSLIQNSGSLVLLDGETFETVLDSSNLKKAEVMYSQGDIETAVLLQISYNEEGTKKLQELSNIYVEKEEQVTNEEGELETVTNAKQVWVLLNDAIIGQTILPNIVYNDTIMLTFGATSDNNELQVAVDEATNAATLLNSGTSKVIYEYSNATEQTKISNETIYIFLIAIGAVFFIMYVYMIIKFKAKGFIAMYFQIGFIATLLLVIRFTNVLLTLEGMAGVVIGIVLEYIFTYIVLSNIKEEKVSMYKNANLQFFLTTLPIYVIAVVFTFASRAIVSSFGMTLFWGIILIYVYNFIFSKFVFENLDGRAK